MTVAAADINACFTGDNVDPRQLIVRPDLLRDMLKLLVVQRISGNAGAQGYQGAQGAQGASGARGVQGAAGH